MYADCVGEHIDGQAKDQAQDQLQPSRSLHWQHQNKQDVEVGNGHSLQEINVVEDESLKKNKEKKSTDISDYLTDHLLPFAFPIRVVLLSICSRLRLRIEVY